MAKFPKDVLFVTSPPENLLPKPKFFFSILTRRLAESVEGLNSSLALAASDLWPKNCEPNYWLSRSLLEFLPQMKIPNLIAYVKGERIFECYHFGQNGYVNISLTNLKV